jgi:F-type H+-transporting ATPase subunit a
MNTPHISFTKNWFSRGFALAAGLMMFSFTAFANPEEHTAAADSTVATETEHATEHAVEHGEEKFDAGKMIIEHISDAHDWHIAGHLAIPLPIILYTDKGLDVFMSSAFEHGHAIVHKNYDYKLEENHIVALNADGSVNEAVTAGILDFSITKNVATLLFSAIVLLWVFLSVAGAYKRRPNQAPKGIQSFVEPIIMFIRDDVAKPAIGHKYEKFMPYLLTAFFFIWLNNMLGLVPVFPGGANLTGNIAVTAVLAIITLIITLVFSNRHYWRHIIAMPGVPVWVLFLLTPIELLGVVLRPFVLMIRLFANITAGHIIALSFFSLIFIFGEMNAGAGFGVSIVSVAFTVFMGMLELLVAFLQAYVFTLLSAIYIGSAVEEGHDHH